MSDPSRYVQSYDFSAFQENQPNTPLPGVQVDVQLADIQTSTTELRDAIKDIRRSDGALMNEIVTEDSLAPGLLNTLTSAADAAALAAEGYAEDAAESAESIAVAVTSLAAAQEAFETGGIYGDYGFITDPPGSSTDYGALV